MAKAQKLPSGAWRCRASKAINGKIVRKSFTVDPNECGGNSKKAKALCEAKAREWVIAKEYDETHMTVEKAIEAYIQDRSGVLSESTIADYRRMPKHFADISSMDVSDVTSKTIQAVINDMAIRGLSPGTIRNRIFFLISAMNYVGIDKRFKLRYPSKVKAELNPPEPSEFHRLLSMATDEEKLVIVLAGLYTLRRGEIGGLCGEDILRDMNCIYVHTSRVLDYDRQWIRRDMPKNLGSVRMIHVDPRIMELIPKVAPKEYVVSMNPNQITKHFERLREKACVDCRFHDLRKYAASIRSEIMPSKYVEADGGWKKGSNVLSTIYDRPFKETRNEYSKKLNKKIIEDYGEELFG